MQIVGVRNGEKESKYIMSLVIPIILVGRHGKVKVRWLSKKRIGCFDNRRVCQCGDSARVMIANYTPARVDIMLRIRKATEVLTTNPIVVTI